MNASVHHVKLKDNHTCNLKSPAGILVEQLMIWPRYIRDWLAIPNKAEIKGEVYRKVVLARDRLGLSDGGWR